MSSVEQQLREHEQEEAIVDETGIEKREKTTNLRSKRRGRFVHLVDKSSVPSMLSNVGEVDPTGFSPETLALVREFENRRKKDKKDRVMRRRALNTQRSKGGSKKR